MPYGPSIVPQILTRSISAFLTRLTSLSGSKLTVFQRFQNIEDSKEECVCHRHFLQKTGFILMWEDLGLFKVRSSLGSGSIDAPEQVYFAFQLMRL